MSSQFGDGLELLRRVPRESTAAAAAFSVTRAQVFTLLLGCAALHIVLRWVISETAGIDDVDRVLRAQLWSWGYGPQPPLYTWLTKIFLGTFGYSVCSLLLLKESLILVIYGLVYAATRQLTRSHLCAAAALALLEANFSLSWEAHRELTHTVLVSAMSVATLYSFLRLNVDRWSSYVVLGICCGLGILSKYNFAVFWIGLWLGALCVRDVYPVLFNRKMLASMLIAVVICLPHLVWVAQHGDLAFSSVNKLRIVAAGDWGSVLNGLKKWVLGGLAHVGPMLVISVILFGLGKRRRGNILPQEKMLRWTLCWIAILVTLNIVIFRVSGVQDRYFQPLLVWLPILLITSVRDEVGGSKSTLLFGLSAVAALVIALVAPGRILLTERLRKHEVLNTPFRRLARDLAPAVNAADCVIAENHTLAGNLRLWFPSKLVLDPEVGPLFRPGPRPSLLVWNVKGDEPLPKDLLQFTRSFTGKNNIVQQSTVEELLKYHHRQTIRLRTALIQ